MRTGWLRSLLIISALSGCASTGCDATVCVALDSGPSFKAARNRPPIGPPVIRCAHADIIVMQPRPGFDYCKCAKGAYKSLPECR